MSNDVGPLNKNYRYFEHTADLGMEIFGANPREVFTNAGYALFEALVHIDAPAAQALHPRSIEIEGEDWADLMINWLRELLYLFNGDQQVLSDIRIASISEKCVKAEVVTQDFSPERHRVDKEIKAVTYHQLQVGPVADRWRARVIFDI